MDIQTKLDKLFLKAKQQPVVSSFGETKERFLNSLAGNPGILNLKRVHLLTQKNILIMLVTLSTIALVVLLAPGNNNDESSFKQIQKTNEKQVKLTALTREEPDVTQDFNVSPKKEKKNRQVLIPPRKLSGGKDDMFWQNDPIRFSPEKEPSELQDDLNESKTYFFGDQFIFPKLTPEEIEANHKQKKKMLKNLSKFDKKSYSYIPSATFDYNDKKVSVQGFYMQTTEVTNLEYRTFLFDILIQGRKDEFKLAAPDQSLWVKTFGDGMLPMQTNYFSHELYNDYPVNNISCEGAELYCKWITVELRKSHGNDFNDVRIPYRTEWVMAASNEGKQLPFPWQNLSIVNEEGCYLANFDFQTYKGNWDDFCVKKIDDSITMSSSRYTSGRDFFTVKVSSFNSNHSGLYNMSGNVAEMVYETEGQTPGTAGGGWMSTEDEIKILAADPYKGETKGHPNIGFRIVMTYNSPDK